MPQIRYDFGRSSEPAAKKPVVVGFVGAGLVAVALWPDTTRLGVQGTASRECLSAVIAANTNTVSTGVIRFDQRVKHPCVEQCFRQLTCQRGTSALEVFI